jgi:putative transcriptional regulator
MIVHHPSPEQLFDYAAGTLNEAQALIIAAHCSLCAACARQVAAYEALGGATLDEVTPAAVSDASFAEVLARLDDPIIVTPPKVEVDRETRALIPAPLRRYLGGNLRDLPWRSVGRMYEEVRLELPLKRAKASLMRLKPGTLMPQHGHRGQEWTLVLAGGYSDGGESFGRGDFDAKDPSHRHQPRVDDDGECLCLVVLDAPVKLTGTLGLFVNPFLRI